jgi:hypothetical protein
MDDIDALSTSELLVTQLMRLIAEGHDLSARVDAHVRSVDSLLQLSYLNHDLIRADILRYEVIEAD